MVEISSYKTVHDMNLLMVFLDEQRGRKGKGAQGREREGNKKNWSEE